MLVSFHDSEVVSLARPMFFLHPRLAAVAAVCVVGCIAAGPGAAAPPVPRLLAEYQPDTRFDPLEPFGPSSIQSFVADSVLEQLVAPGTWTVADDDPEPGDLPGPGGGTWRLNQQPCTPASALGGLSCYEDAANDGAGAPAVYGRVARENDEIVLQYWYFYYDDVYSYTYPASDFIWQAHEGDWEVVNVVLSAAEEPLYVGYSQHCVGERRSWTDTPRSDETHPIVHVAFGSHANYFSAGVHAIDVSCIPQAAIAILVRNGLPLPVDYAHDGPALARPVTPIHQIDDDHPTWVGFPGFWGEQQVFHAPPPIGTVPFGTAPVGPAYHDVWSDPLGTLSSWPAT